MRLHELIKVIQSAGKRVDFELADLAVGGKYARGVAREGYAGGYRRALSDVLLASHGVRPSTRDYWTDWSESA